MDDELKIEAWHAGREFWVRVGHDAENGTAIARSADNLPDALEALAAAIRRNRLGDRFWDRVSGKGYFTRSS